MKILVACFSLTGKTELIAKKLASLLGPIMCLWNR